MAARALVSRAPHGRRGAQWRLDWLYATGSGVLLAGLALALSTWQTTTTGLGWAVLDVFLHAALASLVMVPLLPVWGPGPVLAAAIAAVLIDVDHVVAAQSLDPHRLMSLDARPPTHSLLATLIISGLVGLGGGPRYAYAVALGLVLHLLLDATEQPGVPLLVPVVLNQHVLVPAVVVPLSVFALLVGNTALAVLNRNRLVLT